MLGRGWVVSPAAQGRVTSDAKSHGSFAPATLAVLGPDELGEFAGVELRAIVVTMRGQVSVNSSRDAMTTSVGHTGSRADTPV